MTRVEMPIFRSHRPKIRAFEIAFGMGMEPYWLARKIAPFWIRDAHRANGHKPFKPWEGVDVSEEIAKLSRDTVIRSKELHSVALVSQVILALENHTPLDRILSDLKADRYIHIKDDVSP
jgi:hypothetical protein